MPWVCVSTPTFNFPFLATSASLRFPRSSKRHPCCLAINTLPLSSHRPEAPPPMTSSCCADKSNFIQGSIILYGQFLVCCMYLCLDSIVHDMQPEDFRSSLSGSGSNLGKSVNWTQSPVLGSGKSALNQTEPDLATHSES